ncbi:MAG: heat-inducible transcription repressor HrcA [Chloroflexi bacterium]|nr:MAG: heat-inducible transcription repressor HrcA [Chloroflexota bacterium]
MPKKPDSTEFPDLDPRARQVFGAVIREYIATAEPVASAQLVRGYRLDVSTATVRNELAALEDAGLLTHPHTSAGRVPTDLGYRYFIETLMPSPSLRADEQVTVSHQFQQALQDTAAWLRVAASSLARLTAEASIVTPPASKRSTLRHVEVVPIHERRVLLVVVVEGGAVHQQVFELGTPTTAEHLRRLSSRLTESLGGATATKVQAAISAESGVDAEITRALARILEDYETFRASSRRPTEAGRCSASSRITRVSPRSCLLISAMARFISRSVASTGTSRSVTAASSWAVMARAATSSGSSVWWGRHEWTTPDRSVRSATWGRS